MMVNNEAELKELEQFGEILNCKEQVCLHLNAKCYRVRNITLLCMLVIYFATTSAIMVFNLTLFAMGVLILTAFCLMCPLLIINLISVRKQKKNKEAYAKVATGKFEYTIRLEDGANVKELRKKFRVLHRKDNEYTVANKSWIYRIDKETAQM